MILDEIIEKTKLDLEKRKKEISIEMLGQTLSYNPFPPRDVKPYLRRTEDDKYRIIAEVKKASPSKGVIRENFDYLKIAQDYEAGGASAISVLTEPHYFKGNIEYISQIRRYSSLPLLRKDFIIDKYQIMEAVAFGADFILLIAKALSKKELKELLEYAFMLGLEVLVEIHDKEDLIKAIFAGANIIGVNHRNLDTFEMDMQLTKKLMSMIPNGKIIVAESGINDFKTIQELSEIGVDAFLIGEYFMRQDNIIDAVKQFKGELKSS